jgi:hypothetical protein
MVAILMPDANRDKTRPWVKKELIVQVQNTYRESRGLTASALVDWALRYVVLLERKAPMPMESIKRKN